MSTDFLYLRLLEATGWGGGLYIWQYILFFILLTGLSPNTILLVPVLTTSIMKELRINSLKPRGSICTICLNRIKFCIMPTEYICVFCMALIIEGDFSLSIIPLAFVEDT
jgi:hypothetical protein